MMDLDLEKVKSLIDKKEQLLKEKEMRIQNIEYEMAAQLRDRIRVINSELLAIYEALDHSSTNHLFKQKSLLEEATKMAEGDFLQSLNQEIIRIENQILDNFI
ncbi:MAG: hypothetical protein R2799_13095 [Crocinitomicaceae bacterium]